MYKCVWSKLLHNAKEPTAMNPCVLSTKPLQSPLPALH